MSWAIYNSGLQLAVGWYTLIIASLIGLVVLTTMAFAVLWALSIRLLRLTRFRLDIALAAIVVRRVHREQTKHDQFVAAAKRIVAERSAKDDNKSIP